MLFSAIVLITLALVAYTLGVWAERRARSLRWWHVGAFAAGLTFDVGGTAIMARIAATTPPPSPGIGAVLQTIMSTTGLIALSLMAVHLSWAVLVMIRDRPHERARFHRYSAGVWTVWLVPYLSGMVASMAT